MATARFILANMAETATWKNGTGGSPTPPARSEVAPFTMERALNADRRSLWKLGAPNDGSDWLADLDFGSAKTVSGAAVHGISCPGGVISAVWIGYINDTVYPSTLYVPIQAMPLNGRDAGATFGPFTYRYWFLIFQATAAPVVGRVKLGEVVDIGNAPDPGSNSTPSQNRIEQEMEDGSFNINELGEPGHDFSLSFDPVLPATRDKLESLHRHRGSLTYFDPRNRCFEVVLRQGARMPTSSRGPNADAVAPELARLP